MFDTRILIVAFLALTIVGCDRPDDDRAFSYDPPGALDTRDREINLQERRAFAFPDAGVWFSNDFEGGRLNDMRQVNDTLFEALILPENAPINNSPWYAFKSWSNSEQVIHVHLTYEDGNHRYWPKLSPDGAAWTPADSTDVTELEEGSSAVVRLTIPADTLWVSAQELLASPQLEVWVDSLAALPYVRKQTMGTSRGGRAMNMLTIGSAEGSPYVVGIGRQHPPEVTGSIALKAFVERLAADDVLAEAFRSRYNVLVIPLMNPDGVDEGHWRHSLGGVDLNRDWEPFNQHETALARDAFLELKERGHQVIFALDFHSTGRDLFYTIAKEHETNPPLLIDRWLERKAERLPDYYVEEEPTGIDSPISKNWFFDAFDRAPAVIYEVGDDTDRDLIRAVAVISAEALMELLIEHAEAGIEPAAAAAGGR